MPTYRLLQARLPGDPVRHEERVAFATRLGVPIDAIHPLDLLEGRCSFDAATDRVDAVLVGGAGSFGILDDEPWLAPFIDTLGALADAEFPTFASCFGFQGLVVALGGEVICDEPNAEVGSFDLELAPEAQGDPVFGALPARFVAQLGHRDRATRLPTSATPLASSARCPFQALRIGRAVYATQFHPELDVVDNRARFARYQREYATAFGSTEAQRLLDSFRPSPEADTLLARFQEHLCNL